MSCIGRRLSAAPRAALPHQKIAQRRERIYEQLRRDPHRANNKKSRREGGRQKHSACPHQQDQHPMPSASYVRTTPSSKGQTAARVLRQLSQDGHRAPPKYRRPSKITPTQHYCNHQQTYDERPTATAIQLLRKGRPRITPNNQQRRGGAPPNNQQRRGGKHVLRLRQRVPSGKRLMGKQQLHGGGINGAHGRKMKATESATLPRVEMVSKRPQETNR